MKKQGPARINFSGKKLGGFTLIELLVVIAIIGILSGIVLTSLNSARSKANDAKVQMTLNQVRSAAEIYYSSNSYSYGTADDCTTGLFADTNIKGALDSLSGSMIYCNSAGTTYVVAATLPSGSGSWCVDNTGTSTAKSANPAAGGTSCNY